MNTNNGDARQQLKQVLMALFLPDELIELRFIESWTENGRRTSRVVRSAQWLTPSELLAQHGGLVRISERERANIYFGVCPRAQEGDSHDDVIKKVRCLWCDMDDVTDREALDRWQAAAVPTPSVILSSGTGIHAYWLLDRDICEYEERERFQSMLPHFYRSFRGDHVQNLSRVLRLPGTMNYKDARCGRTARPCSLLTCEPLRRYPLQTFRTWFAMADSEVSDETTGTSSNDLGPTAAQLSSAQRQELAPLVSRLDRPVADRSRRDFAIVCDLLRLGLSSTEIWGLVAGRSKFRSSGRPYFNVTVNNALRIVRRDGESIR